MENPRIDLEACPFCGCDAAVKEHHAVRAYPTYYTVGCTECGAVLLRHFKTPRDAAARWNRRKSHGQL